MSERSVGEKWRNAWADSGFQRACWVGSAMLLPLVVLLPNFFAFLSTKPGLRPPDPVLDIIGPHAVALPIFLVLYAGVLLGIGSLLRRPEAMVRMLHAYALLLAFRMASMFLFTLEPPAGIIPLMDPLTSVFYPGQHPFLKDLFFSGHTATPFLFALAVGAGVARRWLMVSALVVGVLVLVQHVHYTVDVIAAPVFAVLAWWLAGKSVSRCGLNPSAEGA